MANQASGFVYAFGSQIAFANVSAGTYNVSGAYTTCAQTMDIETPEQEVGDLKITNNGSPTGGNPAGAHEYAPGMTEPGDTSWKVVYVKSLHEALLQMQGNGKVYSWQETFVDGTTYTFPGYLKSAKVEGKTEDGTLEGTLKVKAASVGVWA